MFLMDLFTQNSQHDPASALVRSPHTQSPQGPLIPMSVVYKDLHAAVLSSQKAPRFRILI